MLLLIKDERERFALWCEMEAKSDNEMAGELQKMMGAKWQGGEDLMVKRMKQRAMAYSIVALELRKIEDMSI